MFNVFGAVTPEEFTQNYKDSEALIVNQVRCEGRLFSNQLLEQKPSHAVPEAPSDCSGADLKPYSSQFGLQGKIYTAGYDLISKPLHISPAAYIVGAQALTALMSAVVLALFVLWVRSRVGSVSSISTGLFIAISPMLVGFGRNLYWAMPLLVLPLIYVLYFYNQKASKNRTIIFWIGLGALLYLRYLCGYEYITTLTIMAVAAASYSLFMRRATLGQHLRAVLTVGLVSGAAFCLAIVTHVASLNAYTGTTDRSVEIIMQRAKERTINSEEYIKYPYLNLKGLAASHYAITDTYVDYEERMESGSTVWAGMVALSTYALLPVIHMPVSFPSPFNLYIQSLLAFGSILLLMYIRRDKWVEKRHTNQVRALFLSAFIGFLGYASWLVMAYSHSLVHAHINGVLMYLPFALFGYILIGLYAESLYNSFIKKHKKNETI